MEILVPKIQGLDNMAFDSQDRLFVSHANNGTIFQVLPIDESRIVSEGGMIFPGGVCAMTFGDEERVIVADLWTIKEFDARTGEQLQVTGRMATGSMNPSALTFHPDGDNLIVSTWMGGYVYIFDPVTDQVLEVFDDPSWVPTDAIRFMGEILLSDQKTGSIKRADNTTVVDGFSVPSGLAAVGNDLYAADWGTGTVWQVFEDGSLAMVPVATGLSNPEGLAVDIDGSLLVVEAGTGELCRIDVQTGEVSLVMGGIATGYPAMPGFASTWMFSGVDVGPSGNIYVTGDIADVLYKIPATERVINTIDELPDGAFRDPARADVYRRKIGKVLGTVQRLIDKGRYSSARAFLRFLRRRTDGTGKDWVVHTGYQQALMDLIDTQIASLEQQIQG
jgi:sugar lactone lactonase YvrE